MVDLKDFKHLSNDKLKCPNIPVINIMSFAQIFNALLGGEGIGISCEKQFIEKLPVIQIQNPKSQDKYTVKNSIVGITDAYFVGLQSWFKGQNVEFDFNNFGSGEHADSNAVNHWKKLFETSKSIITTAQGRQLSTMEVYEIFQEMYLAVSRR